MDEDVARYYSQNIEEGRLEHEGARIEFARTKELLERFLPPPPARVLDIGGGPGTYSGWLADLGYDVRLIDPVPLHIEQARARAARGAPFEVIEGEARTLEGSEEAWDAVLLMGPLYHLVERDDRVEVLRKAGTIVRRDGLVIGAGISRFASLLDGLKNGYLGDPRFDAIVEEDLRTGVHRNRTAEIDFFTTSYFHHPHELRTEAEEAGLVVEAVLGIEGPGWLVSHLWDEPDGREAIMRVARAVESETSVTGASSHLLLVARTGARAP